jgi:hypothetical protein
MARRCAGGKLLIDRSRSKIIKSHDLQTGTFMTMKAGPAI